MMYRGSCDIPLNLDGERNPQTTVHVASDKKCTYPLRTPRTKLSTKKDPQIMRVTKYNQGQELPTASFI